MVTASLTLLPQVTRRLRVPRALSVPFPLGFPLGEPANPALQREVLRALLALTGETAVPLLAAFRGRGRVTEA